MITHKISIFDYLNPIQSFKKAKECKKVYSQYQKHKDDLDQTYRDGLLLMLDLKKECQNLFQELDILKLFSFDFLFKKLTKWIEITDTLETLKGKVRTNESKNDIDKQAFKNIFNKIIEYHQQTIQLTNLLDKFQFISVYNNTKKKFTYESALLCKTLEFDSKEEASKEEMKDIGYKYGIAFYTGISIWSVFILGIVISYLIYHFFIKKDDNLEQINNSEDKKNNNLETSNEIKQNTQNNLQTIETSEQNQEQNNENETIRLESLSNEQKSDSLNENQEELNENISNSEEENKNVKEFENSLENNEENLKKIDENQQNNNLETSASEENLQETNTIEVGYKENQTEEKVLTANN